MTPGDWLASSRSLPVFADRDLSVTSTVHMPKCPAAATPSGIASMSWCKCQSSRRILPANTPVCLIEAHDTVTLVHEQGSGPFWIEGSTLHSTRPPPPSKPTQMSPRHPPADYLKLEAALGMEPFQLPRRRRAVKGGEIVFVRAELGGNLKPWRFLGLTFVQDRPAVLLIDPSLPLEAALSPGWDQQRTLSLLRGADQVTPSQLLIPAYPLPSGATDPGWTGDPNLPLPRKRPRPSRRRPGPSSMEPREESGQR